MYEIGTAAQSQSDIYRNPYQPHYIQQVIAIDTQAMRPCTLMTTQFALFPIFHSSMLLAIQTKQRDTCMQLKDNQGETNLQRLQSIAITRWLRLRSARPADGRDAGGVRHGDEADDHEQDVGNALPGAGGDGAVVHQGLWWESVLSYTGLGELRDAYGVNVHERNTSERSDDGDELIKIVGAEPCDHSAQGDHGEAEDVLLPLDPGVVFAGPAEELLAGDLDGRVDLQGR